jgi:hypothetical protein
MEYYQCRFKISPDMVLSTVESSMIFVYIFKFYIADTYYCSMGVGDVHLKTLSNGQGLNPS